MKSLWPSAGLALTLIMLLKLTEPMLVSYHEEHLISEFYVIYAISHLTILFTELDLWLHQATIMNCNDSVQKKWANYH